MILDMSQNNNHKDKFEIQETELRKDFGQNTLNNFAQLISGGDLLVKTIFSREDFLLVFGGVKPATDFELPKSLLEKYDISDFESRLEKAGLKMASIKQEDDIFHAYIYSPKLLVLRSQKLEALVPFSEADDLNVWIEKNMDAGVGIDMVLGSLLGFPQSSIDAYMTYKNQTKILHHAEKFGGPHEKKLAKNILKIIREEKRHFVESHGESYLVTHADHMQAEDVVKHEALKKEFFENLSKNAEFHELWQKIKEEAEKSEDKLSWEAHN